jgi:NADH-quinone oxidoreductase subunit N
MSALIITAVWGVILMFSGLFAKKHSTIRYTAIIGIIVALVANILDYGKASSSLFDGMLQADHLSIVFITIILGSTLIYFLLSGRDFEQVGNNVAEYFALEFFILSGICIAASFTNLLMLFLAIEIISIPQYILAGSDKRNLKSNEASLKYFLMGAFSTGFLLMGITLIYGATGTFKIAEMNLGAAVVSPLVLIGILFLLIALSFKVSAAPFHFWTPDVYDGAPTVFTSFMATIVKLGGFIAFIRLFEDAFSTDNLTVHWSIILAIITACTLVIGNFTAVFQQSVKRMLAYSSIAQAGFILFAVIALNNLATEGIIIYAAAYCIATIGTFAVLLKMKDYTFDGFNGLAKKHPLLAATNAIFLLSLAGIPATAGFMAKYFVLAAAVQHGSLLWLVILAVICAAISVYYYFKVIIAMYFKTGEPEILPVTGGFKFMLVISAALIILFGIFPNLLLSCL